MKISKSVIFLSALVAVVLICFANVIFRWTCERVYVAPDEALMVTNKFGDPLPPDRIVVPRDDNRYKGVQEEIRGPGRYFLNPVLYDWQIVTLVDVPAGEPDKWAWDESGQLTADAKDTLPKVAIITLREGKTPLAGQDVVDPGYQGVQKEVLTPGVYKLNPQQYEYTLVDAVVIPPGSVGVVTRLVGDVPDVVSAPITAVRNASQSSIGRTATADTTEPATEPFDPNARTHLVVGPNQRGVLQDVLQPGIYYVNPRMVKITPITVGYDAINLDQHYNTGIQFFSSDGYKVKVDFTVVWGRSPADAPHIVANIGSVDQVEKNVLEPAMKAACQNEGGRYTAKELIQGQTRSQFQDALSAALEEQVQARNVHVLLALLRDVNFEDSTGQDATVGLRQTIQQANIEVERDLTNQQKTQTATVAADLQQAMKLVDVAREQVDSQTTVMVADIKANGDKTAAETDAQRDLDVAAVEAQIAQLDAQRTEILGKAQADVARLRNEANAKGAKMLIDAFGDPQSYNAYIFAQNFDPTDLRLIFAGPGTFWTDLKTFQDAGAAKIVQQQQPAPDPAK
jgi:SPFH domain / Band 7 family